MVLKSDFAEFKKDVALKSDFVALKSDFVEFKKDVALKSDLTTLKDDILNTTKHEFNELTVIISNSFTRFEKSVDGKFEGINGRIDEVNVRLDNVDQRQNTHDLDYVSRNEHNRLEKRVRVLETA